LLLSGQRRAQVPAGDSGTKRAGVAA